MLSLKTYPLSQPTLKLMVVSSLAILLSACQAPTESKASVVADNALSKSPNIIVIMADDMGFSDVGAYGSEIATPNLDNLAQQGVKFSRFYTSISCSPSRSMLMTGADNHLVGIGNMAETIMDNQIGKPGYETYINSGVSTIGEDFQNLGYHTYMAGKWHLGLEKEQGPAERGFDKSFSLLFGGGSHYSTGFGPDKHRPVSFYRDNGKLIRTLPDDFYSSNFYTDKIMEYIRSEEDSQQPFMAYLALTAPHWPLQFPPDYNAEYENTYKVGWNKIRQARLAKLRQSGLFSSPLLEDDTPDLMRDWDTLSADEQKLASRDMEIYAAMVSNMDRNVGRLIAFLQENDLYDNTLILFLSDNGADHWSNETAPPVIADFANQFDNSLENRGQPDSYVFYGEEWARVSNTPFNKYKGTTNQGGMRVPAFMKLPDGQGAGQINHQVLGIEMVKSTLLDVVKGSVTAKINPMLNPLVQPQESAYLGREMWGKQGIISGQWSLVKMQAPQGTGQWQLFDVVNDPAETTDLALQFPDVTTRLKGDWLQYVEQNGVVMPKGKFYIRPPGQLPVE